MGSVLFGDPRETVVSLSPKDAVVHPYTQTCIQFQGIHGPLGRLSKKPQRKWFSNLRGHQNQLKGARKKTDHKARSQDLLIQKAGEWEEERIFISNNFPGDADSAGLRSTFLELLPYTTWNTEFIGSNV